MATFVPMEDANGQPLANRFWNLDQLIRLEVVRQVPPGGSKPIRVIVGKFDFHEAGTLILQNPDTVAFVLGWLRGHVGSGLTETTPQ